jgi:hypothetical protein
MPAFRARRKLIINRRSLACTLTWICGALKVWCDATRSGAASDRGRQGQLAGRAAGRVVDLEGL